MTSPSSKAAEPTTDRPPGQSALWRHLVYNRATRDGAQLNFDSGVDWGHKESIENLLEQAKLAARDGLTPMAWWSGSSQERAWGSLHEAEAELDEKLGQTDLEAQARDLLAKAKLFLKPGDERVKAVSDALAEPTRPAPPLTRVTVAHLSRAVYDAMDRRFAESLACRNRIIRLTLISLVALGVLMAAFATNAIPIPIKAEGTTAPSALKVALLVPLFGAIGALIIAIPPLARVTGHSNPFGLQHYQMLLKVTLGPVFAIVGVMLLQSGLIPSVQFPMPFPDLLVWALVFGATQQVVTRAIDSRVAGLVSDEPTEHVVGAPRNPDAAGDPSSNEDNLL